jgi:hypothetical protein
MKANGSARHGIAQVASLVTRASAADRSHKNVFTTITQAGDSGPQAIAELSTLDVCTLLMHVDPAIITKSANLSKLSKPL